MDGDRFDRLTKLIGVQVPRRRILKGIFGGLFGLSMAGLVARSAKAAGAFGDACTAGALCDLGALLTCDDGRAGQPPTCRGGVGFICFDSGDCSNAAGLLCLNGDGVECTSTDGIVCGLCGLQAPVTTTSATSAPTTTTTSTSTTAAPVCKSLGQGCGVGGGGGVCCADLVCDYPTCVAATTTSTTSAPTTTTSTTSAPTTTTSTTSAPTTTTSTTDGPTTSTTSTTGGPTTTPAPTTSTSTTPDPGTTPDPNAGGGSTSGSDAGGGGGASGSNPANRTTPAAAVSASLPNTGAGHGSGAMDAGELGALAVFAAAAAVLGARVRRASEGPRP